MCGCRMIGVPLPSNMPVCTFQHKYCKIRSIVSYNPSKCSCGLPCVEMDYTTQISYSRFPDEGISKILRQRHAHTQSVQYQRENLVFLQVGFRHQGYTLVKRNTKLQDG
ncbi:hypothetical protein OS493_023593 [Desmophyllum pertusum]|uniref:Uncharacterized protein n=1 Tax=Desmophyllum pertusum TaxID=174260 RepID=A0A9W9ZBI2_9CNID|nr:hypothetical protein OS493_023593 [Desmophyllum pertusum]